MANDPHKALDQVVVEENPRERPNEDTESFQVVLDESEKPQQLANTRKWIAVAVISSAATCVTCASSMVS